jgi:hypothetical protein
MVPVKGIVGYGRFTAHGGLVAVTQHCRSLNESGTKGSEHSSREHAKCSRSRHVAGTLSIDRRPGDWKSSLPLSPLLTVGQGERRADRFVLDAHIRQRKGGTYSPASRSGMA